MTDTYNMGGVEVHTDAMGSAVRIGGVTQIEADTGTTVQAEPTTGSTFPRFLALTEQKPVANWTAYDIANGLNAAGLTGRAITATSNPGLSIFAAKRAQGGRIASGAVHRKYFMRAGVIVPQTLTCEHRSDATLSHQAMAISDGANEPLSHQDNVALPTGIDADDYRFTLGPATIASQRLLGLRSVELAFGCEASTEGEESAIWDTICGLDQVLAVLTLRGIAPTWLGAAGIPITGSAGTHANTTLYLRRRVKGGSFYSDASAVHTSITAAGLAYISQPFSASGKERATCTLMMPLFYDGTNDPAVIDTAAAITV